MTAEVAQLFIGNLTFDTTESDLDSLLSPFGKISKLNLVVDRDSGKSKGFAFATFEDSRDGEDAIKDLDGSDLNGRNIVVNRSNGGKRDSGSRDGRRGRDNSRGSGCFNCGKEGHMSRECPNGSNRGSGGRGGGGRGSGSGCFKCGQEGHISRDCPEGGGRSNGACFNCGKEGHISRECPEGGRGGRSGGRY